MLEPARLPSSAAELSWHLPAFGQGGALWLQSGTFNVFGCVFENCSSGSKGGALSGQSMHLVLSSSRFTNNRAAGEGDDLYCASASVSLQVSVATVSRDVTQRSREARPRTLWGAQASARLARCSGRAVLRPPRLYRWCVLLQVNDRELLVCAAECWACLGRLCCTTTRRGHSHHATQTRAGTLAATRHPACATR